MAKWKNVGFVAKSRKDPSKTYIKMTDTIEASQENPAFISLFQPKNNGDKMSEEEFNEKVLSWKKFDLVVKVED